jgi:hypothetical protein
MSATTDQPGPFGFARMAGSSIADTRSSFGALDDGLARYGSGEPRAVPDGTPMRWHLDKAYTTAGNEAPQAFWGEALSMFHQLAKQLSA